MSHDKSTQSATTLDVTSPYDGSLIKTLDLEAEADAEAKLQRAVELYRDRDGWLEHDERIAILRKLSELDIFGRLEAGQMSPGEIDYILLGRAAARFGYDECLRDFSPFILYVKTWSFGLSQRYSGQPVFVKHWFIFFACPKKMNQKKGHPCHLALRAPCAPCNLPGV
jgi:hypothetical protein